MKVNMSSKQFVIAKRPILVSLSLLLLVSILGGCRGRSSAVHFASVSDPGINNSPINNGPPSGMAGPVVSYADVVSRVSPAVITIHSEMRVRTPQQFPFMNDPMFRQLFGDRAPQQSPEQHRIGLGSGVIISTDGYILTNHHVIDGAEQIKVDLNDNRTLNATVVGIDPPSDLAVLKIDAANLPVLALGDSDKVRVGDVVLAIGNPLGIGQTVTMGIISAKGRQTGLSNGSFEDFLQTDAPINQGNSGGALVSTNSELIGINSQIISPSGGSIGIGFSIPSNMARTITDTLVREGKVRRGQLGIVVARPNSEPAKQLGITTNKGVVVTQVQPGSAAERAGLIAGDVIIALNDVELTEPNVFRNQIASSAPGSEVTLTILRDGRERRITVTLGELPPMPERGAEQQR
jgi:Do/DeqQ family serine protease